MTDRVDDFSHRCAIVGPQPHGPAPVKVTARDFRIQYPAVLFKLHPRSLAEPLSRVDQGDPGVGLARRANEKTFGRAASGQAAPQQPSREDLGVIDDNHVTSSQQRRQPVQG